MHVRPAVARIDDAQPREAEIAHRARRHADVLAELRLDQNHDGPGDLGVGFGLVGARTGHSLLLLLRIIWDACPIFYVITCLTR